MNTSTRNKYRLYHPRGALIDGFVATKHPLYHTHANMLDRCLNERSAAYKNYGGRGIRVCERWICFANFVVDIGPRPTPAHTVERIDNDSGYCPANCTWATRTTQCLNRRVFESNTSGTASVKRVDNTFFAAFDFDGRRHTIGRFKTLNEAILARAAYVEGFLAAKGGLHGQG